MEDRRTGFLSRLENGALWLFALLFLVLVAVCIADFFLLPFLFPGYHPYLRALHKNLAE